MSRETRSYNQKDVATMTSDYDYKRHSQLFTDKLGLRFSQSPLLVWEKIPFSFVLDYFVNIGGWLQQIREPSGLITRKACYSSKLDYVENIDVVDYNWISGPSSKSWKQSIQWLGGSSHQEGFDFQRSLFDARTPPELPEVVDFMSWKRKVTVATLAYVTARRKIGYVKSN